MQGRAIVGGGSIAAFSFHSWVLWFAATLLVLLHCRPSAAQEVVDPGAGTLIFQSEAGAQPAPRVHSDIDMEVTGIIARVRVTQQFQNPGDRWVEGIYVFPLPENSAVNQLYMEVGERVIVGEIREKADAQQLYQQARDNGQRASVVHQQRPNIFRTAVANIGPHETIKITISFLQIVDQLGGRYSLRFPLTITPRYVPGAASADVETISSETPVALLNPAHGPHDTATLGDLQPAFAHANASRQSVSFRISIDAGVPVENIQSAYHGISMSQSDGDAYRVELAEKTVAPDRDFQLAWTPVVHGGPAAALFRESTASGEHVLLMFMPPQEREPLRASREVIFIIDTSGSMSGASIEQARQALLTGLSTLLPTDRFNLIQFNSTYDCLFDVPVDASAAHIDAAQRYVTGLNAQGGTEMLPALSAAFRMPHAVEYLRQIVFITDGAVSNEAELMSAIRQGLGDARLFTVGIGSAPNGYFMRTASQMGRGTFTFIGNGGEVHQRMNELLHKLTSPVLTDIELHWPNDVTPDYAPARVGDLYADEPLVITARLPEKVSGTLTITGKSTRVSPEKVTPFSGRIERASATFDHGVWGRQISLNNSESRSGVATLWARNRIEDIVNQQGPDDQVRAQVLPLALEYQLVSKYTSLVAIDKTPARKPGESLDSTRIDNTKPQGQNWNVSGMPTTATPAELQLLIGVLSLLAAASIFISARRRTV